MLYSMVRTSLKHGWLPVKEEVVSFSSSFFVNSRSPHFIAGPDLDPSILFRILEILHSTFKAGRIQIADYISFFITLLSRFRVLPGIFDWKTFFALLYESHVDIAFYLSSTTCAPKGMLEN